MVVPNCNPSTLEGGSRIVNSSSAWTTQGDDPVSKTRKRADLAQCESPGFKP